MCRMQAAGCRGLVNPELGGLRRASQGLALQAFGTKPNITVDKAAREPDTTKPSIAVAAFGKKPSLSSFGQPKKPAAGFGLKPGQSLEPAAGSLPKTATALTAAEKLLQGQVTDEMRSDKLRTSLRLTIRAGAGARRPGLVSLGGDIVAETATGIL